MQQLATLRERVRCSPDQLSSDSDDNSHIWVTHRSGMVDTYTRLEGKDRCWGTKHTSRLGSEANENPKSLKSRHPCHHDGTVFQRVRCIFEMLNIGSRERRPGV